MSSRLKQLEEQVSEEREARLAAEKEVRELRKNLDQLLESRSKELLASRDEALMASKRKTQFLSKVSEQLKTPLNGILGICRAVEDGVLPPTNPDTFGYVKVAAEHLLEIVRDVLDLTDVEEGKMAVELNPLSLGELLDASIDDVLALTGHKDLRFESRVAPDLHPRVLGDYRLLNRVLMNLIHNSMKFTENGVVEVKAERVAAESGRQTVRFTVLDTGCGMSSEQQTQLVTAFSSGGTRFEGVGLGLMVVNRLVNLMGGEVSLESQLGAGTKFSFDLDFQIAETQELETPTPPRELDILLVEDEEIAQQLVLRMLDGSGHKVSVVADGEDALKLTRSHKFDLILMDLGLPKLNGFEAATMIRRYERENRQQPTTIIALTVDARREECLACGMNGLVQKPLSRSQLLRVVNSVTPRSALEVSDTRPIAEVFTRVDQPAVVLVVEDDPTNRVLVRNVLKAAGHTVREATNGEQALKVLFEEPIDVVVMDVVMPKMDGFEACARIKNNPRWVKIPVVLLTSLEERKERIKAFDAGADDFLTKPVDTRQLKLRVRNAAQSKRLVDEVQKSYQQLQRLEELRFELVQMVVHDMRGPLTGILGYAQLLEFASGLDSGSRDYLKTITALSSNLREMVSSILDVSRLETDELALSTRQTDLVCLLREELELVRPLHPAPMEWTGPEVMNIVCDSELIRRVFSNLLTNARKYNPEDMPIKVSLFSFEDQVRVEVRDHGPGVPEELRSSIFEKFCQVEDARTRKSYSSGLGLTFCKLVVEKHGGHIGIDPPIGGKGSIFWFELPIFKPGLEV